MVKKNTRRRECPLHSFRSLPNLFPAVSTCVGRPSAVFTRGQRKESAMNISVCFFFSLSLDLWGYLITFSVEDSVSDNSSFLFATAIGYPLFLVTMWFLSLILPFEEIHKVYTRQGSNGKRKKKRYNVERCVLAHFVALDSPRQRQKWRPADYRGQFWRSLHTEWR